MGIYLKYVFIIFIFSMLFPIIFSLLALPLDGLAAGAAKASKTADGSPPSPAYRMLVYVLMAVIFVGFLYLICGWSAYVAIFTHKITLLPSVQHDWFYFVSGFFLCHGPLGYMASKEGKDQQSGSCLHILAAMAAYIVFCIWPAVAEPLYGWFLQLVI